MKKRVCSLIASTLLMYGAAQAQDYEPLTLSLGFNEKVVAYGPQPAEVTTTAPVNSSNDALMSTSFTPIWGMPGPSYALPADGFINSMDTPGLTFQLRAYNLKNCMQLATESTAEEFVLETGTSAVRLHLLAMSCDGASVINAAINFTDDTSQLITNITVPDWMTGNDYPVAIMGIGYVKRDDNVIQNPPGGVRLFEVPLLIDASNQEKTISSVTITKTSAAGIVNAFAISAQHTEMCVTPNAPYSENQAVCGAVTFTDLFAVADEGNSIRWYHAAEGGTPYAADDEVVPGTYFAAQVSGGCESARTQVEVSFVEITDPVADAEQTFCDGATVASLAAEVSEGAVLHWYLDTDGDPVDPDAPLMEGVYYAKQFFSSCQSHAVGISVTLLPNPDAPVAASEQTFCEGAIIADIAAAPSEGNTIVWYNSEDASEPLDSGIALTSGSYYAKESNGVCEGHATEVNVTVTPLPATPDGLDDQQFEAGETVSDLEITLTEGAMPMWYIMDEGILIPTSDDTPLTDGETYYVTQHLNGCESAYFGIAAHEVLGTGNYTKGSLSAYPNPVSYVLTITDAETVTQASIVNVYGQNVLQKQGTGNTMGIDVSGLAQGVYFVNIIAGNRNSCIKILKQ